jgi:hypothetical protein
LGKAGNMSFESASQVLFGSGAGIRTDVFAVLQQRREITRADERILNLLNGNHIVAAVRRALTPSLALR